MSDWVTKSQINRSASSFFVFSLYFTTFVLNNICRLYFDKDNSFKPWTGWLDWWKFKRNNYLLFQTVSDMGFRQSHWPVGAMSKAGFWLMFANLHDNISNAKDTNQAVNGSLAIFLCVPFLDLMTQRSGPVLWLFSIACATGALSSKQNGGIQAKVQFEVH